MTDVLEQIQAVLAASTRDLEEIERTLTDGYACALSIEAEKWRLEKRMAEVTSGIQRGDTAKKARELVALSRKIDGKAGDLTALRALLVKLRRHADGVRVGSPAR